MTTSPPRQPMPNVGEIFGRSWHLLRRNPIVALPMFAAALIVLAMLGVLAAIAFFGLHITAPLGRMHIESGPFVPLILVVYAVSLVLYFGAFSMQYGLADAVWTRGSAVIDDGWRAARTRSGALAVALLGFAGLGILAVIAAFPTLGISMFALVVFTFYVIPAVVAGKQPGIAAIGESFRLTRRNLGVTIIALIVIVAIQYGTSLLSMPFILPFQFSFISILQGTRGVPMAPPAWVIVLAFLGYAISIGASLIVFAYAALVQTGLYRVLKARAEPQYPLSAV